MVPAPITRRSQLEGLGQTSISRAISSVTRQAAIESVKGVTFRSQFSPDIALSGPQATGAEDAGGGIGQLFMRLSKPSIYVDTHLGVIRIAPWGEPKLNLFPLFLVGTIVGTAVVAGLIIRGIRK